MKKLLWLILLIPTFAGADALLTTRGKMGTLSTCVTDADVDVAFATTVDADSAAAAKTLNLTATTNLAAGDTLLIDKQNDGDGREMCVVDTVSAGVSVDCVDNLTITHLGATGDDVTLTNRIGPLNVGEAYYIQLVTAAGAPQSGQWIMGDEFVDSETNGGVRTAGSLGRMGINVKVTSSSKYISVKSLAASAISSACHIR